MNLIIEQFIILLGFFLVADLFLVILILFGVLFSKDFRRTFLEEWNQ